MSVIYESLHLLESNRENCKKIFLKPDKSPNDIADFLISLHLVLEIGLNGLFREIIINNIQKTIDKATIVKNLDNITFINKATLFVYMEKYDFEEINDADKHHSLIKTLIHFSQTRNQLMHGSMIGSFQDENDSMPPTVEKITPKHMEEQIKRFHKILEGITFYLDHLKFCPVSKEGLKEKFLDTTFIK